MKRPNIQMSSGSEGGSPGAADASPVVGKRKRILLIEDEPTARLVLLQKLRAAGFDVDVAVNGLVGLEKICTGHPDAIFMDLLLPQVEGVDVIKAARKNPKFANRPVYVCTSAARMGIWAKKGTKAGATKVFDRASTPIDDIVKEVAADLLGTGPVAQPSGPEPSPEPKPKERFEDPAPTAPTRRDTDVAGAGAIATPSLPDDDHDLSATQSPVQPPTFMKRLMKSLGMGWGKPSTDEPDEKPVAASPAAPGLEPENAAAGIEAGSLEGAMTRSVGPGVAVLTLDEGAKILSANKTIVEMFGWQGPELVGQNLSVLLKDGCQQDITKLLEQLGAADQGKVACPVVTVARRTDGTEFPVSITTLTWSSETTLIRKSGPAHFCWTAFIREVLDPASPPGSTMAGGEWKLEALVEESRPPEPGTPTRQAPSEHWQTVNADLQKQLQDITAEAAARQEDLAKRQKECEELAGRVSESEAELNRARTELEQESGQRKQLEQQSDELKQELQRQTAERSRLEAEWREQLSNAETLTKRLETGWQEEAERNRNFEERLQILGNSLSLEQAERSRRFEAEVLGLRQERDELQGKLTAEQQATAEFKQRTEELETRLHDSDAEADRVRRELEKQTAEQQRLDFEWRETLRKAEALTLRLQVAWQEAEAHSKHSEEELAGLRQVRDNLQGELAAEHEAATASQQRNEELAARVIQNNAELARLKAELESAGHSEQFDERLNGLKQARAELDGEMWTEQQVGADSRRRIEDLETRLRDNAAELERVRAEADKRAEEQARLQSELQAELSTANSTAQQAEAALKEKTAQCSQFETQLATLARLRDELGSKLAAEQQAGASSRQRSEELESRLRDSDAELERVKEDHHKEMGEQLRREAELRGQLDAARAEARAAAERAETALKEESAHNRAFEERLQILGNSLKLQQARSTEEFGSERTSLQQERDELGAKLTAEQRATAESRQRCEELENRLRQTAAELERTQTELARHTDERTRLESEQRAQIDTGKAATEKAEAAWLVEAERNKRFEEELAGLRRERDELNRKFTAEQQAVAESTRHADDLENQLCETAAALEGLQAELARHSTERARWESQQRLQVDTSAATERAEAARLEEAERSQRLAEELANLQRERDELEQKFTVEQQAVAESRRNVQEVEDRLRENAATLEGVRADLARHVTERAQLESAQHARLDAARAAAETTEAALAEKTTLCNRVQEESAKLWQDCEALSAKLASEQQTGAQFRRSTEELENRLRENAAELETLKANQHQQAAEQKRLETEWSEQLTKAQAAAARAEEALREEASQRRQVERSIVNLRNERHQVYDKFRAEHEAGLKSKRRIGELEKRLRERAAELGHARSKLEKQTAEHSRTEAEWRGQLETARSMAHQELSSLRQEREALTGRLATEQQAAQEFRRRTEEFEDRLRENDAELERVRLDLDQHVNERARLESEHRSLTEAKEALGLELRHVRESEAAHQADIAQMEGRLAESVGLLARVTGELETESSERHRLEQRAASLATELQQLHEELKQHLSAEQANERRIADLLQQLRERDGAVTRLSMELQAETLNRQTAEEQLRATSELGKQLRNHLSLLEEAKQVFASRERDLEARLQASVHALRESESSVEKETGERRRLEEALQAAQREHQRQGENNAVELSKLKSTVELEQLERKGLEAQILQARYSSLDSGRVGAEMVNRFRNRIRQPIEKLMHSTRRLLEMQPEGEQKKLVESVLENALLLQTSVRDGGTSNAGSPPDGEQQRGSDESRSSGLRPNEAGLQP